MSLEKVYDWLDERLSIKAWQEFAGKKKVPLHKNTVWYYMGGVALMILLIQVVTGILLMVYYVPEINSAHSSVQFINSQVDFGWFFRSMHSWGANIMILVLFIHMFSTFFMKAYRKPRELTWVTGIGLLVICFAFGFTGYLLPWDEIAFFATKIGLDITESVPVIGNSMALILRGGEEIGQATLSRFFLIHVIVLPVALLLLLGVHLLLVQLHGMSEPKDFSKNANKDSYEPFFPNFVLKDMMVWLLVLNALATLAVIFPWGLGPQADAFAPAPVGIKPEWYFLGMFQFLKILPSHIGFIEGEIFGLLVFFFIGLIFVMVPFIDTEKRPGMARVLEVYGLVVLIAFIIFTWWGFVA
jgi:quinol-cytochrome oxidoreductase complex cytochrome b subunit